MRTMIAAGVCGLVLLLCAVTQTRAGERKDPYPTPTSFDPFRFTSPSEEIAMARSAAPLAISDGAEILKLGKQGCETAVKGKNGFACLVQRWGANSTDVPGFSQDASPRATIFFAAVPKWSAASLALPEKH